MDFTLICKEPDFDERLRATQEILDMMELAIGYNARPPKGEMLIYLVKVGVNLCNALRAAGFDDHMVQLTHSKVLLKIKIDINIDPPEYMKDEIVVKDGPLRYSVCTNCLPVLFVGKTTMILCRQ